MSIHRFQARSRAFVLAVTGTLTAASGLLGLGSGCGSSVSASTLCEQICTCQGCTKTETEACQAEFAKAEKLSGDQGCEDAYGTFTDCLATNLKCVDDKIDGAACVLEVTALNACAKAIPISTPGGGGFCDAYAVKAKSCVCPQLSDPSAQTMCEAAIDQQLAQIKQSAGGEEACKAALDSLSSLGPTCQ